MESDKLNRSYWNCNGKGFTILLDFYGNPIWSECCVYCPQGGILYEQNQKVINRQLFEDKELEDEKNGKM